MKRSITVIFALMAVLLFFAIAYGEGNAEKGKALFNDPRLGGGKAGVSCNSCHPDGKNAADEADDKGVRQTINACIQSWTAGGRRPIALKPAGHWATAGNAGKIPPGATMRRTNFTAFWRKR